MLPSSLEARREAVSAMSSHPAASSATANPAPGGGPLAGLTLGIGEGLDGAAERAVQALLAAGAALPDRSGPADALALLREGGCDVVIASDADGLLRRDAGRFGLFGLRTGPPVPHDGPAPLDGWGWLAREAADFARVAEALLGQPAVPLPDAPRCLIAADTLAVLHHDVRAALAPAIEAIEDLFGRGDMVELAPSGLGPLVAAYRELQADGRVRHPDGPDPAVPSFGPDVRDDDDRDEAEAARATLAARLGRLLAADGLLILPTLPDGDPGPPGPARSEDEVAGHLCPAALAGLPQVSLPLVRLGDAPLGLSLLGPAGSDLSLCRLAVRIARELRPPSA